jgi:hypothetical protein
MARRRKPPEPLDAFGEQLRADAVYIATVNFASDQPRRGTIVVQGDRLRGDHPIILTHASRFVPDGTPRSEWPQPGLDRVVAASIATADAELERLQTLHPQDNVLEPTADESVELLEPIVLRVGERVIPLAAGERLPKIAYLVSRGVVDPAAQGGLRLTSA